MQFLAPTSAIRQLLARATCAIALVGSLAIYHRAVVANPLTIAQSHWEAIAQENSVSTITRYSPDAVLVWSDGTIDTVFRGDDIHLAWQQFFSEYQIQEYQVVKQHSRERTATAVISIIAKLDTEADAYPLATSPYAEIEISYQVHFDDQGKILQEIWQTSDDQGKILQEIWQTTPELSV